MMLLTRQRLVRSSVVASLFTVVLAAGVAAAPDKNASWPQFLGPDRNGISRETGLLKAWPADGPKEVWRVSAGVGMSGLAIDGGRLVTMWQDGESQYVL